LTVTLANNGREAVDLASSGDFDLILMDMQMPELDGLEATRLLRQQGSTIPVVPLTANVMQKHRDAFARIGCKEVTIQGSFP
jgi:two-component system, sensor histidine kinase